ncbi:27076_t:CDS:1, partial [Racocetra persica]
LKYPQHKSSIYALFKSPYLKPKAQNQQICQISTTASTQQQFRSNHTPFAQQQVYRPAT